MFFYSKIEIEKGIHYVSFPQFENINTYGESLHDALVNAEEALNGSIESDFDRKFMIPETIDYKGPEYFPVNIHPHIEIAIQLRKIRNNRSQVELASEIGISYQAYQRLENPRRCNPTIKTLEKIAKVLNRELEVALK